LFRKYITFAVRENRSQAASTKVEIGFVSTASGGTYRGGFFTSSRFCPTGLISCSSRKYFNMD